MSPTHALPVSDFFKSDTPIRPRSKIPRRDIPRLVLGFCWPVSVPELSKATGYTVSTLRAVYFAIRELLPDARYRRWHSFENQSIYELDHTWEIILSDLLWSLYAACYENQECQRNYLYAKRANRECAVCPILRSDALVNHVDDAARAAWLRLVDRTRDFYLNDLAIRKEPGLSREVFRLRAYHQQIVNNARYQSRVRQKDGSYSVDHLKKGPGTVVDLWSTILAHIEERGQL